MKKNIKVLSLLLITLLFVTGCGKVPTLENGQDAVVSLKGNEKISVDELYKEVKDKYVLETVISMVDKQIFESLFKDYKETAKKDAEGYLSQMKEQYESETEFLMAIQQHTAYSTIEAYADYVYLSNLQNHATSVYAKEQITDKQIKKYYKDVVKGDIEVSHILITPDASASADEDEIEKAESKAKETANNIIKELNKAKKDKKDIKKTFEKLVEKHTDDQATKENKGSLGKINNYNTLPATYDELIDSAYELKDGEYSTKLITTELGYHIILRTKSHEKQKIEKLSDEIREILGEQMLQADPLIPLEALKYYRNKYELKIHDKEINKQYKKYLKNFENSIKKHMAEQAEQNQ